MFSAMLYERLDATLDDYLQGLNQSAIAASLTRATLTMEEIECNWE